MFVKEFVFNSSILWWTKKYEQTSWAWGLYQMPHGATRLVTRVRAPYSWHQPLSLVWLPLLELADFPMMRKSLLGIKLRAETLAAKKERARGLNPTQQALQAQGDAAKSVMT